MQVELCENNMRQIKMLWEKTRTQGGLEKKKKKDYIHVAMMLAQ